MGRTIPTYRLHLESILNDWMDYRRALREKDREVFDRLLNKSRQHSSAASYCAHIDPSILALLSVLLEMERDIETLKRERSSAVGDSGPVRIREATVADRGAIVRTARASFDRVYAFFAVRGMRHAWPFLVAEDESSIAGFLEGILFPGTSPIGYVYFVAVDPRARGMGSGRALVQESLRLFRSRGADRVFAAVPRDNDPSMHLFESLGFERVARRVLWRWYHWRGLSVQMRMLLAPHEVLLTRTFTDLPLASPQEVPRAS